MKLLITLLLIALCAQNTFALLRLLKKQVDVKTIENYSQPKNAYVSIDFDGRGDFVGKYERLIYKKEQKIEKNYWTIGICYAEHDTLALARYKNINLYYPLDGFSLLERLGNKVCLEHEGTLNKVKIPFTDIKLEQSIKNNQDHYEAKIEKTLNKEFGKNAGKQLSIKFTIDKSTFDRLNKKKTELKARRR